MAEFSQVRRFGVIRLAATQLAKNTEPPREAPLDTIATPTIVSAAAVTQIATENAEHPSWPGQTAAAPR